MAIDMRRHNRMKLLPFALGLLLLIPACGKTEQTEEVTAEIEAAQMEGRNAAKLFLSRDITDSLQLQRSLLEAKAKHSKYIIEKKQECADAFDSTFVSTLRSVRPDLANEISRRVM